MNAILYNFIKHKKINGSLFYCFEYFIFLKDHGIDIKYIIMDITPKELEYVKSVFIDKYKFNGIYLNDLIGLSKRTDLYKQNVKSVITLDTRSLELNRLFMPNARVFPYASHQDSKNLPYDFYGFYEYQKPWKYKTRLKLYKEIHRLYDKIDNKVFFSSSNVQYEDVQYKFPYDPEEIIQKHRTKAIDNLFANIKKVIYYGSEMDVNNRIVVECFIHGVEFELHTIYDDSTVERENTIKEGRANELFLDLNDRLLKDFIRHVKNCKY